MARGRLLGGCVWLLGGLALLQTLYLRALPSPHPHPPPHRRPPPPAPPPPRGVLDASGSYWVYWDILGGPFPNWDPPELILATHGTPGRVAGALGGALGGDGWGGPLSVAVFGVPRRSLEELLAVLRGPCRRLRPRLRLHVVTWGGEATPLNPKPPIGAGGGCRGGLRRLAAADPPSYVLGVPYPGNLLRNVAWGGALGPPSQPSAQTGRSSFVLLVDADVVPSRGLREEFLAMLGRGGGALGTPKLGGAGGDGRPGGPGATSDHGVVGNWEGVKKPGAPTFLAALVPTRFWRTSTGWRSPRSWGSTTPRRTPTWRRSPKVGWHQRPGANGDPGGPNVLENPNDLRDPGVPNVLENLNALKDPKGLEDPNALENPNPPTATPPWWDRVLFVLPAFEIRAGTRVPGTKAELLRLWGAGQARPFYGTLCPRCQAPTDYGRWRVLPPAPRLRVAYEVAWRDPWEPFYVGPARGAPPFDERFLQYGFNRISQACELHVAGFRFAVLDGAFVAHRGFKEPGAFHGAREAELRRNRRLFRRFRDDLRRRYPRSPRRC
ncbi:beta-1,4-glucuronyltransferase 1 [Chlamydotis macqueenii]